MEGVTRAEFEDMLEKMPQQVIDGLWEHAETEAHQEKEAAEIDSLLQLLGFEAEGVESHSLKSKRAGKRR